jgi:hypothetical protein
MRTSICNTSLQWTISLHSISCSCLFLFSLLSSRRCYPQKDFILGRCWQQDDSRSYGPWRNFVFEKTSFFGRHRPQEDIILGKTSSLRRPKEMWSPGRPKEMWSSRRRHPLEDIVLGETSSPRRHHTWGNIIPEKTSPLGRCHP